MIKHIAFVMDGNRRWAKRYGFMPWQGHQEGINSLNKVLEFCIEKKIEHASFYTFSLENFKRPEEEKQFLFDLVVSQAEKNIATFVKQGARVRFIGDRMLFPDSVRETCERIELATSDLSVININFLFGYGAQQEIVHGVKTLVKAAREGLISEQDVDQSSFSRVLWTAAIPDPELIIRTGGVRRLSNFLLYQAAYSEIYFLDCLWPEITREHLNGVLDDFAGCQRNFGA